MSLFWMDSSCVFKREDKSSIEVLVLELVVSSARRHDVVSFIAAVIVVL